MNTRRRLAAFGIGAGMGFSMILAFPEQSASTESASGVHGGSLDFDGRLLLCEGGTLDQFGNAVEHYMRTEDVDRSSKLGLRLATLHFDHLLAEAYIAANYPNFDLATKMRPTQVPNADLPVCIDESFCEEERRIIHEALLGGWKDFGAQPTGDLFDYLVHAAPSAAFDANWNMPYAAGRLANAETIAKSWLASDAGAAFHHLSAVEDLPTTVRLMLVESIATTDMESAIVFIEGSPVFIRSALVEKLIAAISISASQRELSNIYERYYQGETRTPGFAGLSYRDGLTLLVGAAKTRAPELAKVMVEGIESPDVRVWVERMAGK